jgi:hypothetical protein
MLTISPVYQENASDVYQPFFNSGFLQLRLSQPGLWHGRASELLPLTNPVQRPALENLLKGMSPGGNTRLVAEAENPDRLAAWRVVITLPPVINRAWSLRPRHVRLALERDFVKAVNRTLKLLERRASEPLERAGTACLFAAFRTKAAQDFSPQIQATVLFLNLGIQPNGRGMTFSPERIMGLENGLKTFFERQISPWLAKQNQWWGVVWKRGDDPTTPRHTMTTEERAEWSGRNEQGARVYPLPWHVNAWQSWARRVWSAKVAEGFSEACKDPATAIITKAKDFIGDPIVEPPSTPIRKIGSYAEFADTLRIAPVFRADVADTYGAFFQRPLAQEMLLKMGHWQGRAVKVLQLKNPIDSSSFGHLIDGRTPDGSRSLIPQSGEANRLAGWRVIITAPQGLNWVWGVCPKKVRVRVERAFAQAVQKTLRHMELEMPGYGASARESDKAGVFAVFRHNAASDYSPQLQATVLCFNLGLRQQQMATALTTKQVMAMETKLKCFFHEEFRVRTEKQIELMPRHDQRLYGNVSQFFSALSPLPLMSPLAAECWSGRTQDGGLSTSPPLCFRTWKEWAEGTAQCAHDTRLDRPGELKPVTSKFIQGWRRRARQRARLAETHSGAAEVPVSNHETAKHEAPVQKVERDEFFHGH